MDSLKDITTYMISLYTQVTKQPLTQNRMHNLLYLMQIADLSFYHKRFFDSTITAEKDGAIVTEAREMYEDHKYLYEDPDKKEQPEISEEAKSLVQSVMRGFAHLDDTELQWSIQKQDPFLSVYKSRIGGVIPESEMAAYCDDPMLNEEEKKVCI